MRSIVSAWMSSFLVLVGCGTAERDVVQGHENEPIVGLPCEGCEAVFQGMPDSIPSSTRIASASEPGEPMRIDGVVRDSAGQPVPGIIVYAYHTNAEGIYPTDPAFRDQEAFRHGRLRGWAKSDANGSYRFESIRPAGYPGTDIPQHVHMHVIEPGRCTYYIDDIFFDDDPRFTGEQRKLVTGRGGLGIVRPVQDEVGVWRVTRDITLGEQVPGYTELTSAR